MLLCKVAYGKNLVHRNCHCNHYHHHIHNPAVHSDHCYTGIG